jgi:hypothetical protein
VPPTTPPRDEANDALVGALKGAMLACFASAFVLFGASLVVTVLAGANAAVWTAPVMMWGLVAVMDGLGLGVYFLWDMVAVARGMRAPGQAALAAGTRLHQAKWALAAAATLGAIVAFLITGFALAPVISTVFAAVVAAQAVVPLTWAERTIRRAAPNPA